MNHLSVISIIAIAVGGLGALVYRADPAGKKDHLAPPSHVVRPPVAAFFGGGRPLRFSIQLTQKGMLDGDGFVPASLLNAAPQHSEPTALSSEVRGILTLQVVASGLDGFELAFRIAPRLLALRDGNGHQLIDDHSPLANELTQTCRAGFSDIGRLQWVSYADGISTIAQSVLNVVVSKLQLVIPDSERFEGSWLSIETDINGDFAASYKRVGDARIEKKTIDYKTSMAAGHPGAVVLKTAASDATVYEWKSDYSLSKVAVREHLTGMIGSRVVMQSDTEIEVGEPQPAREDVSWGGPQAPRLLWRAGAWQARVQAEALVQIAKSQLGNESLPSILSGYKKLRTRNDEVSSYKKMKAYIQLHHEGLAPLVTAMVEGDEDGPDYEITAVALGNVGSKEAQAVLRDVMQQKLAKSREVLRWLPLLAQTKEPDPKTVAFLVDVEAQHRDEAQGRTALLALGATLGAYEGAHPEEAGALIQSLVDRFSKSEDVRERVLLLDALGNARATVLLELVRDLLTSSSEPIEVLTAAREALAAREMGVN